MTITPKIGEQIAASRVASETLSGARRPPPSQKERDYLVACAQAGTRTLEWLRDSEAGIRRGKEAVALLRRRLPELPGEVREEVIDLLKMGEEER
jgi:hypothetical protein